MRKLNATFRSIIVTRQQTVYPFWSPDKSELWGYTAQDVDGLGADLIPSGNIVAKIRPAFVLSARGQRFVAEIADHNGKQMARLVKNAANNRAISAEAN